MAAAAIPFSNRPGPAAGVAFGSLLDLARFRRGRVAVEVCDACQTINPSSAKFCKACAGKMPAFYAALERGEPAPQPVVVHGLAWRGRNVTWITLALWGAVVAVALFQAFGPRRMDPPAMGEQQPASASPVLQPVARVDEPASGRAAGPLDSHAPRIEAARQEPPAAEAHQATPEIPGATAPAADAGPPKPLRKAVPTRAASSAVYRSGSSSPLARCSGRNFFARAVCMNNVCAQRSMSRSPQCAETVRQRRLDEARRNPKLLG